MANAISSNFILSLCASLKKSIPESIDILKSDNKSGKIIENPQRYLFTIITKKGKTFQLSTFLRDKVLGKQENNRLLIEPHHHLSEDVLLKLNLSASFFKSFFDLVSFVFGHTSFNLFRSTFNKILSFRPGQ